MRLFPVVLALLAACSDSRSVQPVKPPQTTKPAKDQIRVMSYNVNFGVAGDESNIEAIRAAKPDVVFLQETNEQWEAALVAALGEHYPHRRFDPPTDWAAGGMGVLSRLPIEKIDVLTAPKAPFFAWRTVLDTTLGRIQVFNFHLRPPMSDGGSWVVGYFSTRADRLREMQYHLEALDPKMPAIMLGDFNEERDAGQALALLEERGFSDAIGQFHGKRRTWEWDVKGLTLKFQLDHIFHDAHFVPTAAEIVEAGRSDHKPIWADFVRIDP
jgi:endonuclease/exonuclease/phosphatase (EEP) superfamily protein YafD